MREKIASLIDHYAQVTDGTSGLVRSELVAMCQASDTSEGDVADEFAREVVRRFSADELDAEGAAFAVDDLLEACDFTLPPFARQVFDLLEYREASPADAEELLMAAGRGHAA